MSELLTLDCQPQPICINPTRTAVIVVDMQNDFGSHGGMFDRAGIDISGIQKTINPIANVLAAARRLSIKIIYLKMGYHPNLEDLGDPDAPNRVRHVQFFHVGEGMRTPDGAEGRILVRNTWGTDIVDELKPEGAEDVIYKTRFSGFYRTRLDAVLKSTGIKHLIITGCTTAVCVESTIRDAFFRDYHCVLLTDCTSEPIGRGADRSNQVGSILLIRSLFGWTATSEQFLVTARAKQSHCTAAGRPQLAAS